MKQIDYLIIHSTNTNETETYSKAQLINKHTATKRNNGFGWNRPGIDALILQDGTLETIIDDSNPTTADLWDISLGRKGLTGIAKHIAYVGGRTLKGAWEKDTRTDAQKETLETLIKYYILRFPKLVILGFNEIPSKMDSDNPGFKAKEWLESIGVSKQNIYT